jgi:hypothetical protein
MKQPRRILLRLSIDERPTALFALLWASALDPLNSGRGGLALVFKSWNMLPQRRFSDGALVQRKGRIAMRSLISILALALAVAFTAPAFAGPGSTITNKEDCEKAGKKWDEAGKKCVEKQ